MNSFDSLSFAQKLKESGVPSAQAETEVALLRDQIVANSASKSDLSTLEERLIQRFEKVENRIEHLQERLTLEMRSQQQGTTSQLERQEQSVSSELKLLEQRVTIKLYATMAVAVTLIVAAQKLLTP